MCRLLASVAVVAWLTGAAWAEEPPSAADWVDRGNAEFRDGRLIDALDAYREADKLDPDAPAIAFNRGLAHYLLGEAGKARELFNAALLTEDRRLEGRAKFNLGNCDYAAALGVQEENPRQSVQLLKSAINYYCDSLDVLPDNADARSNMQLARRLIKQLEAQLEQQKQQQEQDQDEQKQQEQPTTQPDQEQEQQPTSQPSEQDEQATTQPSPDEQQQEGREGAEEDKQQGGEQAEQQDAAQQQTEAKEGEEQQRKALKMSKEQAQRLLQAIRDKEQARRMQKAERRRTQPPRDGKDW